MMNFLSTRIKDLCHQETHEQYVFKLVGDSNRNKGFTKGMKGMGTSLRIAVNHDKSQE